jgi:hypothetical protein
LAQPVAAPPATITKGKHNVCCNLPLGILQPQKPETRALRQKARALFPGLSQTYRNPELRRCGGKARGAHRRNDWPEKETPWPMSF